MYLPQTTATESIVEQDRSKGQDLLASAAIPNAHDKPAQNERKKGKRSRSFNYSKTDVELQLDVVGDRDPIGSSDWATAAKKYKKYVGEIMLSVVQLWIISNKIWLPHEHQKVNGLCILAGSGQTLKK